MRPTDLLALAVVAMALALVAACAGGSGPPTATPDVSTGENGGGTPVTVEMLDIGGSGEYKFVDSEFTFATGEKVTFTFTTETEYHSFTVDDLEIDFEVDAETTESFTFTFDTPGTFELICVPHEAQGMVGTITVQ